VRAREAVEAARAGTARYRDDGIDTHATALAYQVFLSTLALSLVGLAVIGLIDRALPFDLPAGTQDQFSNLVEGSATLGIASVLVLLWTAAALARRASRALGIVFRTGAFDLVGGGIRSVLTTLGLVMLIGALPILTGVITAIRAAAGLERPLQLLGFVGVAVLEFALFLLSYIVLTPGRVGWRAHVPGAVVMTIGWDLFKLAGGVFVAAYVSRATLLYGTIGSVVALLVVLRAATWLYLVGAEISALRLDRRARGDATA
jgi:membrane protein